MRGRSPGRVFTILRVRKAYPEFEFHFEDHVTADGIAEQQQILATFIGS